MYKNRKWEIYESLDAANFLYSAITQKSMERNRKTRITLRLVEKISIVEISVWIEIVMKDILNKSKERLGKSGEITRLSIKYDVGLSEKIGSVLGPEGLRRIEDNLGTSIAVLKDTKLPFLVDDRNSVVHEGRVVAPNDEPRDPLRIRGDYQTLIDTVDKLAQEIWSVASAPTPAI